MDTVSSQIMDSFQVSVTKGTAGMLSFSIDGFSGKTPFLSVQVAFDMLLEATIYATAQRQRATF